MNKFLLFLFIGIFSLTAMQVTAAVMLNFGGFGGTDSSEQYQGFPKRTTSAELNTEDKAFLSTHNKTSQAYYSLGNHYMKGGNQYYKKASKLFEVAAEGGYEVAKYHLGEIYEEGGQGIKQDYQEAFKWYTQAAEEGSLMAQLKLGEIYEEGTLGVEQDYKEALKWYELADKTESIVAKDRLEAFRSKISSSTSKGKSKGSCATAIGN